MHQTNIAKWRHSHHFADDSSAAEPKSIEVYRELFREHEELVHVTVETQRCHEEEHAPALH